MRDIADLVEMIHEVLGETAAVAFIENFEELTCFIKSLALNNIATEDKMKNSLKKYAEGLIAASVKCYLEENYADSFGGVEININGRGIYDKNIKPIRALETIHGSHKEIINFIVAKEMYEFTKGRHLARIMENRVNSKVFKMDNNVCSKEQVEVEIMRLERKLPNLTPEEAEKLKKCYSVI